MLQLYTSQFIYYPPALQFFSICTSFPLHSRAVCTLFFLRYCILVLKQPLYVPLLWTGLISGEDGLIMESERTTEIPPQWPLQLSSVGKPPARWTDDQMNDAGFYWKRAAQDWSVWGFLCKTYVQYFFNCNDGDDDVMCHSICLNMIIFAIPDDYVQLRINNHHHQPNIRGRYDTF